MEWLKNRLIDDCRSALRLLSVQLHAAVLLFVALYELSPTFPAPVAALFPDHLRTPAIAIYALLGIAARLIKQKSSAQQG